MTLRKYLLLHLQSPMMSFGDVAVDHFGPTANFPMKSMITGLIGNALGYDGGRDWKKLDDLQASISMASAILEPGSLRTDLQSVILGDKRKSRHWSSTNVPIGKTSNSMNELRRRDYLEDSSYKVALRLSKPIPRLSLSGVAQALSFPARPLFLGRAPFIPSAPLIQPSCWMMAEDAHSALTMAVGSDLDAEWDTNEGPLSGPAVTLKKGIYALKDWHQGRHKGMLTVVAGKTG